MGERRQSGAYRFHRFCRRLTGFCRCGSGRQFLLVTAQVGYEEGYASMGLKAMMSDNEGGLLC
jgi:hypothetical protein